MPKPKEIIVIFVTIFEAGAVLLQKSNTNHLCCTLFTTVNGYACSVPWMLCAVRPLAIQGLLNRTSYRIHSL